MRKASLCALLVFVVVVLQYTLVDRLALRGGGEPDVALLLVVGLALWLGPAAGSLAGFATGLAMDLAPPASNPVGELALIFCLVGYGCGRLAGWRGHSVVRLLLAACAGAVAGEALQAAFGLATGDPQVSPAAVGRVLPALMLYDLLVVVIAVGAVAALTRRHGRRAVAAAMRLPPPRRPDLQRPARAAAAVRLPLPRRPDLQAPGRTAATVRLPPPRRPNLHRPIRPARPVRLPARQIRAAGDRSAGVIR